jgi:hypothetical protein
MAGIAEQRHPSHRPSGDRLAEDERPLIGKLDIADHGLHIDMPAREITAELVGGAGFSPGFDFPIAALDDADEVDLPRAADGIVHDMGARPDPERAGVAGNTGRQMHRRHQRPPSHETAELNLVGAKQCLADFRVNAVSPDQDIGLDRASIGKMHNDASGTLVKSRAARIEMNGFALLLPDRLDQLALKIGAMHREIGRAVFRHRGRAKIDELPGLACIPKPDLLVGGRGTDPLQPGSEPEVIENARAIGGDLHTGADLLEILGLLVQLDLESPFQQRQSCGQPAQSGAGDDDLGLAHRRSRRLSR